LPLPQEGAYQLTHRLFSRRSCSLGASGILAVAAVGFAAPPAFAATHHVRPDPRMSFKVRPDPRMSVKVRPDPRMSVKVRPDPRMSIKVRPNPRMS
jgi:hypothetical protein